MLELRPNCELCDCDLPASSDQARMCSYECTFCASCANDVLSNVCPNCGGNLVSRPIRPTKSWRPGTGLVNHPASTKRRHNKWTPQEREQLINQLKNVSPKDR